MYYLFTHNDLDGIGCGIVARFAFGDNTAAETERYLKRNHQAWLVRDDLFVKYLMEHLMYTKKELEHVLNIVE